MRSAASGVAALITVLVLTSCGAGIPSVGLGGDSAIVDVAGPVMYGADGHRAATCEGGSDALHYTVQWPSTRGAHPVVFGMIGSSFEGSATCDHSSGADLYREFDPVMRAWAEAGYVAVNIEYHGYRDGLYGDLTYPGRGRWGSLADGTVQLDIKPAIEHFLHSDPGQYGADLSHGAIVFGGSSGGHDAYMLGITGVPGLRIAAAIGWSGLPDVALAGRYARYIYDTYMRTTLGTDVAAFGDPQHRLDGASPPQYVANGTTEFIKVANAEQYVRRCRQLHVVCWERILDTNNHAQGYAAYTFTGKAPEITVPAASAGTSVIDDSIAFADSVLHVAPFV